MPLEPLRYDCPGCGARLSADPARAGGRTTCRLCGIAHTAPAAAPDEPDLSVQPEAPGPHPAELGAAPIAVTRAPVAPGGDGPVDMPAAPDGPAEKRRGSPKARRVFGVLFVLLFLVGGPAGYFLWQRGDLDGLLNRLPFTGKTAAQSEAAEAAARAMALLREGRAEDAMQLAEAALRADDTLPDAYGVLIAVALERRDFSRTVELLKRMDAKCGSNIANLPRLPGAMDFAASPEYEQWQEYRNAKRK